MVVGKEGGGLNVVFTPGEKGGNIAAIGDGRDSF